MSGTPSQGSFWLPPNASPVTGGQDTLFYFIYYLSVFFFVIIVGCMVFFSWKYRKKKHQTRKVPYIYGNTLLEIVWSVIPSILFVIIFAWGFWGWLKLSIVPQDALEVKVTGKKWDWLFTDVNTGAETSDLIVPVNTPVKLTMYSTDVIHGFYVPDFRINRDVLPTQYTVVWFQAPEIGTHAILCTQYCGTKHSQMVRYVRVVSQAEYEKAMVDAQGAGLTPAQLGQKIFAGKGACASCHDVSKNKKKLIGPPLFGAYGENQTVVSKSGTQETLKFDDAYIRESILNPNFRVVVGYPAVMPPYQGQLSDKEITALTEYIKTLK